MTTHIGASKISTLLGLNPWETPRDLFDVMTGAKPAFAGNAATRRGTRYEQAVIGDFASQHLNWRIEPWGFQTRADELIRVREHGERGNFFIRHASYPWLSCTPDALIYENDKVIGVLEAKTTNPQTFKRDWLNGPPKYYVPQVQQQMMILESILGYPVRGFLAALAGLDESLYADHEIPKDDAMRGEIDRRARSFVQAVDHKRYDYWSDSYPDAPQTSPEPLSETQTGPVVVTTAPECATLIRELKRLDGEIAVLTETYDATRKAIEVAMKAANVDEVRDGTDKITFRPVTVTDYELWCRENVPHGELAELRSKYSKDDWKKCFENAKEGDKSAKHVKAYQKPGKPSFRKSWGGGE